MIWCVVLAFASLVPRLHPVLANRPPVFVQDVYIVNVAEDVPVGTGLINITATDSDSGINGILTYRLEASVVESLADFAIHSKTGELITNRRLNRESISSYRLTVIVRDGGNEEHRTEVAVNVGDVNDNAPAFPTSKYAFSLSEGEKSRVGLKVIDIRASDPDNGNNGTVRYRFIRNPFDLFLIYERTGSVLVRNEIDRERLGLSNLTLLVEAHDLGVPPMSSTASIHIDIVDEPDTPPTFDQLYYDISIKENFSVGKVILDVNATTPDTNVVIEYSLEGDKGPFAINSVSGQVVTAKPLDYEDQAFYYLVLAATGRKPGNSFSSVKSITSIAVNIVNVNDERPSFNKVSYHFIIPEEQPSGYQVEQVSAYDRDAGTFGQLTYFLTYINESSVSDDYPFAVKENSGIIITTRQLDFEAMSDTNSYVFTLWATDGGTPSLSASTQIHIVIRNIDEPPRFSKGLYESSVYEDAEPGTTVLEVQAYDLDSESLKIIYKLWTFGNTGLAFGVNETSGVISTQLELNRERQNVFHLIVQASDESSSNLFTTASVRVTINDINDNAPKFLKETYIFSISESSDSGTFVGAVDATDMDIGSNGQISFLAFNLPSNFNFEPSNGVISVLMPLDYEEVKGYNFLVWAIDLGNPQLSSSAEVAITVIDMNDNTPMFINPVNRSSVLENQPPDEVVFDLSVTDRDSGVNGRVTDFQIVGDHNARDDFYVDSNGVVSTRKTLDRESISSYTVLIRATDSGIPALSSEVEVFVVVKDQLDSIPIFRRITYDTVIFTFTPRGSPIVEVVAESLDELGDNVIHYELMSHSPLFSIHPSNGTVLCTEDLDPNVLFDMSYVLIVSASVQHLSNSIKFTVSLKKSTCSHSQQYPLQYFFSHSLLFKENPYILLASPHPNLESDFASCQFSFSIHSNISGILKYFNINNINGIVHTSSHLPSGDFSLSILAHASSMNGSSSSEIMLHSSKITRVSIVNGVNLFFPKVLASQFVSRQLIHVISVLAEIFECNVSSIQVLGIQNDKERDGTEVLVSILSQGHQSYIKPWLVVHTINSNLKVLRQKLSPSPLYVGYDGCIDAVCDGNAQCSNRVVFTMDANVHKTSKIVFLTNHFRKLLSCTCPPGFLKESLCMKAANLCESNPCKFGGTCIDSFSGYECSCPPFTKGKNCDTICPEGSCNPCESNPCKNNGKCIQSTTGARFHCSCPQMNMGPLCELTTVTILPSSRVVLPPVMGSFSQGTLTFRFATTESNALLIYSSGLTSDSHMFAVEIENSQLRTVVKTSSRNIIVRKTFSHSLLNDGQWHYVNITILHKVVAFSVSGCAETSPVIFDRDGKVIGRCTILIVIDRILNLNGPFFVGSIDPRTKGSHITSWEYTGCFDALTVNGVLVDLSTAVRLASVDSGCIPHERNDCNDLQCQIGRCVNLWNGTRCICNPQSPCQQEYQTIQITSESNFEIPIRESSVHSIAVKLRTIQPSSFVLHLGRHSMLAIQFGAVVWWNDVFMITSPAYVSDGNWHTLLLQLDSNRDRVSLDVDDGRLTAFSPYSGRLVIDRLLFGSTRSLVAFKGCLADVTINGIPYTMDISSNSTLKSGCSPIEDCTLNTCPRSSSCNIYFGETVCHCLSNHTTDSCEDPCHPNPCINGGTCIVQEDAFICQCPLSYGGSVCSEPLCPSYHHYKENGVCLPCPCSLEGTHGLCNGTSTCPCRNDVHVYSGSLQCQPCMCHHLGSEHAICNKQTGVCQCKTHVAGDRCDRCAHGYSGLNHNGCKPVTLVKGQVLLKINAFPSLDLEKAESALFEELQLILLKFPLTFHVEVQNVSISGNIASYVVGGYSEYNQRVTKNEVAMLLDNVLQQRIIGNFIIIRYWFTGNCLEDNPCYPGVTCNADLHIKCGSCPSEYNGSGITCVPTKSPRTNGIDSDYDTISDEHDIQPYLFNPDQQQRTLPSIPHCPPENSYNITWSLILVDFMDVKPCPGRHEGLITRKCASNGWIKPNSSDCLQPEAHELLKLTIETRNGLFHSVNLLDFSLDLMFFLVSEEADVLGGDLVVLVDYLTEVIKAENEIVAEHKSIWTDDIISRLISVFDSLWYPWSDNVFNEEVARKSLIALNKMSQIMVSLSPSEFSPELSYMVYDYRYSLKDTVLETHFLETDMSVTLHLPGIAQGTSAVIGLIPPTPAVTQVFNTRVVNSPILVIETSLNNFEQNPVTIVFPMSSKILNNEVMDPQCVYLTEDLTWSTNGCNVQQSTPTQVTCMCSHLSVFAATVNANSLQPRLYTVRTVCYILESLASVGLLISVFIIFLYKVPGEGYFVNICILVFIVLVQVTFMGGINRVEWGQVPCIAFSVLLQIFILSVAVWCFLSLVLVILYLEKSYKNWAQLPYYFSIVGVVIPVLFVGIGTGTLVLITGNLPQAVGYPSFCLLASHGPIWALLAPFLLLLLCIVVVFIIALVKCKKDNKNKNPNYLKSAKFLMLFLTAVVSIFVTSLALKVISTNIKLETSVYTGLQISSSVVDVCLAGITFLFFAKAAYSRRQVEKKINEQFDFRERPEGKGSSLKRIDSEHLQESRPTPVAHMVPISPVSIKDNNHSGAQFTEGTDSHSWFSFPSPSPLDPLSPMPSDRRLSIPDGDFDEADVEDWEWSSNTSCDSPQPPSILSPNDRFVTVSPSGCSPQPTPSGRIRYIEELNSMSERENPGNVSWLSSHTSNHTKSTSNQQRHDLSADAIRCLPHGSDFVSHSVSHSITSKYISGTTTASSVSASGRSHSLPRLRAQIEESSETAESYV